MTIKDCIDIVDNIKPNQYTIKDKVMWLSFIEAIIINEVLKTHEGYDGRYDNFEGYTEDKLSVTLIVPSPYDRLYTAYLKMKIDQENGETARYNNSAVLYNSYMQEYRKHYNKTHMPIDTIGRRDVMPPKKTTVGLSDAEYENLKRDIIAELSEDVAQQTSDDKIQAVVKTYMDNNAEMFKGKDGTDGTDGEDGTDGVSCTHSWNGTTLTVHSASGTSSANLKGAKGEPGKDGYTPQKGIDYNDGYTPIKGIDYFDGKDGEDGEDGLTPVKGVDYHDGYSPVRGVDYWTDNDKAEVIAEASAGIEDIVDNRFSEIKVDVANRLVEQDAIIATKADKKYVESTKADIVAMVEQEIAEVNTDTNTELSKKADRDYVDAKDVRMVSYADQKADEAETEAKAYTDEVKADIEQALDRKADIVYTDNGIAKAKEEAITNANAYTDSMKETIDEELVKKASIAYVDEKDAEAKEYTDTAKTTAISEAKGYTDAKVTDAIAESKEYTDVAIAEVKTVIPETANGLKETATGEIVQLNVSPIPHTVNVKVKSKNLIPYPFSCAEVTRNEITFTPNADQTVTFNGKATINTSFAVISANSSVKSEKGKTYTISHSGVFPNSSYITLSILDDKGTTVQNVRSSNGGTTFVSQVDGRFTLAFVIVAGATFDNVTFTIQLEEGDTATEFAKYVDPTTAILTRCKKNLIPYPHYSTSIKNDVFGWTDNGDGTVTANGTPSNNLYYYGIELSLPVLIKAGTYVFSGCPVGGSSATYNITFGWRKNIGDTRKSIRDDGEGVIYTFTEDVYVDCVLVVRPDVTVSNLVFKPMIRLASIVNGEFEVYNAENFAPSEDASYEIESISPMMTLLTDKANTIVEVEYNQDICAFKENVTNTIAQLKQAIIELGGTV